MTESMVEKVARAMFRQDHDEGWEAGKPFTKAIYLNNARAAMKTMRKPNAKMVKAGADKLDVTWGYHDPDKKVAKSQTRNAWRAMNDAALDEKEPEA